MVDFVDEYGEESAPRIAEGLAVLERLPVGSKWTPSDLRALVQAETDLAESTICGLIRAAKTCRNPLFKATGKRHRQTYTRVEG